MNNITALTVEQQARKEAWNANSWNLWSRNTRSSSWSGPNTDIERDGGDHSPMRLSKVHTEPSKIMHGSFNDHGVQSGPENNTVQESNKYATDAISYCDGILPDGLCETAPNSKAADVKTKKERPWYAGKVLHHKPFTIKNQLQAIILNSWVNILLVAAPVGIVCNCISETPNFIVLSASFITIIPLAVLLSFATEEIALHFGEGVGGLLNATFGNAVKIIVAVIALKENKKMIVQTSLIGSILSNLLLVTGMSLFIGGIKWSEQFYNQTVAQTSASLLTLSAGGIIIPTCFHFLTYSNIKIEHDITALSRGTSVILLIVYGAYLFFQLETHQKMFNRESQKFAIKSRKNTFIMGSKSKGLVGGSVIGAGAAQSKIAEGSQQKVSIICAHKSKRMEPEKPQLHIAVAWATLVGATALVGIFAEFMVGDNFFSEKGETSSQRFVGLILLPILGNAAEHATTVTVVVKGKKDIAIALAVSSSMQIVLLVIPLMVVIGWIMGKEEMNLNFDGFQVAILFVSVLLVNYVINDGRSHWLRGMLLMCLYLIIAICAWYYPCQDSSN